MEVEGEARGVPGDGPHLKGERSPNPHRANGNMWGKAIGPTADQPEASAPSCLFSRWSARALPARVDALLLTGGHALKFSEIVAECSLL